MIKTTLVPIPTPYRRSTLQPIGSSQPGPGTPALALGSLEVALRFAVEVYGSAAPNTLRVLPDLGQPSARRTLLLPGPTRACARRP